MHLRWPLVPVPALLFWATLFCLTLPAPLHAQVQGEYETIGPVPPKHSRETVLFEEFLNFTCPHCNHFRTAELPLKKEFGGRVRFVNVPILFRGQNDAVLRLYYIAERAGRGEEMKQAIFDAGFKYGVNVNDPAIVSYLARSMGLGAEYQQQYDADWVKQALAESMARAQAVGVEATPTVVLEKALRVEPHGGMDAFVNNLRALIDQLLKPK